LLHHIFKSIEQLHLTSSSIAILINSLHCLHGLHLINSSWISSQGKNLIKESCKFIWFKSTRSVPVVLHENLINVAS
jgi:hypothetical protein